MLVPQKVKDFVIDLTKDDELEEELGGEMTIIEHLEELRSRIIKIGIAVVISTLIAFLFTPRIFEVLKLPLPTDVELHQIEVTESFVVFFKIALLSGALLSLPVALYQVIRFVAPGLTRKEKRYLFLMLPFVSLFFALGVLFGYFVLLPSALKFLLGNFAGIAEPTIRVSDYITFVLTILFWMGVGFQMPLVIFMLAKVRVLTPQRLASYRKYAMLCMFVIAAVITPTPDPLNQTLVAVPLYLLYEIGVVLARLFA